MFLLYPNWKQKIFFWKIKHKELEKLRTLIVVSEDSTLASVFYIGASQPFNSSSKECDSLFWPSGAAAYTCMYTCMHINKSKIFFKKEISEFVGCCFLEIWKAPETLVSWWDGWLRRNDEKLNMVWFWKISCNARSIPSNVKSFWIDFNFLSSETRWWWGCQLVRRHAIGINAWKGLEFWMLDRMIT